MSEIPLHIQQAEGLERLAAMIRENPELAEELQLPFSRVLVSIFDEPPKKLAAFARAGLAHKATIEKEYDDKWGAVNVSFGPVSLHVYAAREQVCERVVVGTETVTKKVKDPAKLAEVPEIEVTETIEKVKWECKPLLASTKDGE